MASLPDLDTTVPSFLAYWHAFDDGGGTEVDPEDALTHGNINSYDLYDNGVIIDYDIPNLQESSFGDTLDNEANCTVRIKKDGWFVAYIDRAESAAQQTTVPDDCRGPWDIINDWTDAEAQSDIQQNQLERAIFQLQSEITGANTYSYTFATADVGLYNYEFTAATRVTLLDEHAQGSADSNPRFVYTANTNNLWGWATVSTSIGSGSLTMNVSWTDGTTLIHMNGGDALEYASLELVASGAMASAETAYGFDITNSADNDEFDQTNSCVLIVWEDTS